MLLISVYKIFFFFLSLIYLWFSQREMFKMNYILIILFLHLIFIFFIRLTLFNGHKLALELYYLHFGKTFFLLATIISQVFFHKEITFKSTFSGVVINWKVLNNYYCNNNSTCKNGSDYLLISCNFALTPYYLLQYFV